MTTSEFIKMLQEADPEGNCHIRLLGDGIPYYAEPKEGYWDGAYDYIDEEGNYVRTTEGCKVDIGTMRIYDYLERKFNRNTPWEEVEKHIITRFTWSFEEHNISDREHLLERFREEYERYVDIQTKFYEDSKKEMVENAQNGWLWFQDKRVDNNEKPNWYVYYRWKIYDGDGNNQGSNIHRTQPVLESGLWEKRDNGVKEGYYQWVYIGENTPETQISIKEIEKKERRNRFKEIMRSLFFYGFYIFLFVWMIWSLYVLIMGIIDLI